MFILTLLGLASDNLFKNIKGCLAPLIMCIRMFLVSPVFSYMPFPMQAGADPNTSSSGLCALARAAAEGETEFLRSLLAAGANPNQVSTVSFYFCLFFSAIINLLPIMFSAVTCCGHPIQPHSIKATWS